MSVKLGNADIVALYVFGKIGRRIRVFAKFGVAGSAKHVSLGMSERHTQLPANSGGVIDVKGRCSLPKKKAIVWVSAQTGSVGIAISQVSG